MKTSQIQRLHHVEYNQILDSFPLIAAISGIIHIFHGMGLALSGACCSSLTEKKIEEAKDHCLLGLILVFSLGIGGIIIHCYLAEKVAEEQFQQIPSPPLFSEQMLDDSYNEKEKEEFQRDLRALIDRLNDNRSWLDLDDTLAYLCHLAALFPHFSPLPYYPEIPGEKRIAVEKITDSQIDEICSILVSDNRMRKKTLYSLPLQVNQNHRTIAIIDFELNSVEYWNSFGNDLAKASIPLQKIAEKLSKQTKRNFRFENKTNGFQAQMNSYDCGVWVCCFVEHRCKNSAISSGEFKNFNISSYRSSMITTVCKVNYFYGIIVDRWFTANKTSLEKTFDENSNKLRRDISNSREVPDCITQWKETLKSWIPNLLLDRPDSFSDIERNRLECSLKILAAQTGGLI